MASREHLGMGLGCSSFRFRTHLGHILRGPEFQRNSNSSGKKKQKQLWCWSKEFTEWCPVLKDHAVPTPSQNVITGCNNLLQSNFICPQVLSRLQCIANLMEKRYSTSGPFWTLHKHKDLIISDVPLIEPSQYLTGAMCPSSLYQSPWQLTPGLFCGSWPPPPPHHIHTGLALAQCQSLIHSQEKNIRVCFHWCIWLESKKFRQLDLFRAHFLRKHWGHGET